MRNFELKLTLFKTSGLNDTLFEQIMTKLSSPILRSAKSVTAKLRISCTPYIELNIDDEPLSDGFVNCSGNFIDTYIRFKNGKKNQRFYLI